MLGPGSGDVAILARYPMVAEVPNGRLSDCLTLGAVPRSAVQNRCEGTPTLTRRCQRLRTAATQAADPCDRRGRGQSPRIGQLGRQGEEGKGSGPLGDMEVTSGCGASLARTTLAVVNDTWRDASVESIPLMIKDPTLRTPASAAQLVEGRWRMPLEESDAPMMNDDDDVMQIDGEALHEMRGRGRAADGGAPIDRGSFGPEEDGSEGTLFMGVEAGPRRRHN